MKIRTKIDTPRWPKGAVFEGVIGNGTWKRIDNYGGGSSRLSADPVANYPDLFELAPKLPKILHETPDGVERCCETCGWRPPFGQCPEGYPTCLHGNNLWKWKPIPAPK